MQERNQKFLVGGPDNCAKNSSIQNLQELLVVGAGQAPWPHAGYDPGNV